MKEMSSSNILDIVAVAYKLIVYKKDHIIMYNEGLCKKLINMRQKLLPHF